VVRFVRINFENWRTSLDELKSASSVFHTDAGHPTFQLIRDAGIAVEPLGESVNDGAVILQTDRPLDELRYIVDRLLGPGGCPWDQEQTHESLKRCLLEESYEVLEAIDSGDLNLLREELGDLLLQPFMHAQMSGEFDIDLVARDIVDKLIRRHPHVFGDLRVADSDDVLENWEAIKKKEKRERTSVLDGVPTVAPALLRANQISRKAAKAGFEWPDIEGVFAKLDEEVGELHEAIDEGSNEAIASEIGDLLFTVVNLARWLKVEPEDALRVMLDRFSDRFRRMEAASTVPLNSLSPQQWDDLWNAAKREAAEV